ncbi:sensor histidine kinase [Lachnotalea glycerini]|nr:histidine kinase [Lachnotalea glycerini]
MRQLWKKMKSMMDDYKIKKKLQILYVYCVLIPLILTDSVILYIVIHSELISKQKGMENIASAVQYNLSYDVENAASATKKIYMNKYVNQFMENEYESELDYYNNYLNFLKDSLFESSIGMSEATITMYADNSTIINGGEFSQLEQIRDAKWYKYLKESDQDSVLYIYYDDSKSPAVDAKRKISFIRKLNFYERDSCEKIVKMDMDYSNMVRSFVKMNYEAPVYICYENKILLSNNGSTSVWSDFEAFDKLKEVGFVKNITIYGMELQIYVLKPQMEVMTQIINNMPIILLLVFINAILPWIFVKIINYSFTQRLQELSDVFTRIDDDRLYVIENIRGDDEIGGLMHNYNRMVAKINDLIQTVYIDRLREQEMDIERQNAELLALHSQINPHFLFNALESIRMHSILRKEFETAHMVERLAIMERQNVDWGNDFIKVKEEMAFVEAYLELQKYRFGDRLSYQLDISEQCLDYQIPKLTIVTFVENACIHGIESKPTPGWIFVRIYQVRSEFCIEIEDTGGGIEEPLLKKLLDKMNHASIEKLKDKEGVGILNACLRLKMATDNRVYFEVESEIGIATMILIKIPLQ